MKRLLQKRKAKMKLRTVTVKRSNWSRGNVSANALLVGKEMAGVGDCEGCNSPIEGTMCCLGFACIALGLTEEQIRDMFYPSDLNIHVKGLNRPICYIDGEAGYYDNTTFSSEAALINDDKTISDQEREERLINLGLEHGFKFIFED